MLKFVIIYIITTFEDVLAALFFREAFYLSIKTSVYRYYFSPPRKMWPPGCEIMGLFSTAQEISIMLLPIQFFILRTIPLYLLLGSVASCSRYAVTVNDNLVYTPPGLFSQYTIADAALKECVRETIAEDGLTKAEQLTRLSCPPGKIHNLDGLSVFSQLRHLGLASNQIVDITPLAALIELRQIDLHNNTIENLAPLALLPNLEHINVRGNSTADCASIRLDQGSLHTQKLPEHCS